jgi:catechol 2,3-dioxygenase-like lactoylglutathione lyase family enzyme
MTLTVQALDHLVVQVSNLEVSARWYERALGMTRKDVSQRLASRREPR